MLKEYEIPPEACNDENLLREQLRLNMNVAENPDIPESQFPVPILEQLLKDRTTGRNIIWATNDYATLGEGYAFGDTIEVAKITGQHEGVIKPRSEKAKAVQLARSRDKAEVFTPSWVCNKQNNLIDNEWFGRTDVFNHENDDHTWTTNLRKIEFPDTDGKTWRDYVKSVRLEITCGEAPYLTSRYDTVTGEVIEPLDRIGLLDRKFRVVLENYGPNTDSAKWYKWMKIALQSLYGYEWQGDNLLLARENILSSYVRFYMMRFGKHEFPSEAKMMEVVDIITWNIWQMDGLKGVIPCSCHDTVVNERQLNMFADVVPPKIVHCLACKSGELRDMHLHTGIKCRIKDWDLAHDGRNKKKIYFHELQKHQK